MLLMIRYQRLNLIDAPLLQISVYRGMTLESVINGEEPLNYSMVYNDLLKVIPLFCQNHDCHLQAIHFIVLN